MQSVGLYNAFYEMNYVYFSSFKFVYFIYAVKVVLVCVTCIYNFVRFFINELLFNSAFSTCIGTFNHLK